MSKFNGWDESMSMSSQENCSTAKPRNGLISFIFGTFEAQKPEKENSILFDANFYNLLITTLGLLLCGVLTGIMWVYGVDHITSTANHGERWFIQSSSEHPFENYCLEWSIVSRIQVIFRRKDNATIKKSFVLFLVLQSNFQ